MFRMAALSILSVMLISTPLSAEPLPADAKPLSADEITSLYTDKSAEWPRSAAYFAPDHSVVGVFGKPTPHFPYKGTWRVEDNEICMETEAVVAPGKVFLDCWKHWRHGDEIFTLKSHNFDSGKNEDLTTHYRHEIPNLAVGDTISQRYKEAGGQ